MVGKKHTKPVSGVCLPNSLDHAAEGAGHQDGQEDVIESGCPSSKQAQCVVSSNTFSFFGSSLMLEVVHREEEML